MKAPESGSRSCRSSSGSTAATIDVSSAPGRGTTFRVRIPLGTAHVPREQRTAAPLASTGVAAQTLCTGSLTLAA